MGLMAAAERAPAEEKRVQILGQGGGQVAAAAARDGAGKGGKMPPQHTGLRVALAPDEFQRL